MRQLIFYLLIFATLFIGLNAIYRLNFKADLPFGYHSEGNKIISDTLFREIQIKDRIVEVDGFNVNSLLELEFFTDTKNIGDEVELTILNSNNSPRFVTVLLGNYYKDISFILITFIVGLAFWITGGYVFIFGIKDDSARVLSLVLLTFSLATFTSPCFFDRGSDWIGYLIRISHSVSYIFGGLFFLHFSQANKNHS